jgi:hypothetical protein
MFNDYCPEVLFAEMPAPMQDVYVLTDAQLQHLKTHPVDKLMFELEPHPAIRVFKDSDSGEFPALGAC